MSTYMENTRDVESRESMWPSFRLLQDITNGFSDDRVIGKGGYGVVYKGVFGNGEVVAVRKLIYPVKEIDDMHIQNEFAKLVKFKHKNIVRLFGYCYEKEQELLQYNGRQVFAFKTNRAMCFEYVQNGSLHDHISDRSSGLDWHTTYRTIKGICEGLEYLHEGRTNPIFHLDLKPSNILLDQDMTPKISDFGLSRLIGEGNIKRMGTIAYMPPEFIERQVISHKFDIYSLGVTIIELMTGSRPGSNDVYSNKFAELVREKWRKRLKKTVKYTSLERYCQQVTRCLEIALKCVEYDRKERPSIGDIVHRLNEVETLLDVQPPELYFSFMLKGRNKATMSSSSCSLQLKNRGDDRVAFMLIANSPTRYSTKMPLCGVVPPRSTRTLTVTMRTLEAPSISSSDSSNFFTLYSIAVSQYDLLHVDRDLISMEYENFFKKAQETPGAKDEVQVATLNVIYDRPAAKSSGTSPEDCGRVCHQGIATMQVSSR